MDDTRAEQAKFETSGSPSLESDELPWGYGEDRVTAMARDPESAYVYWEITDPGIEAARARLGPAGAHGWCNLRVYDTSGRDFDGVNANDYFDVGVDRREREYFLMIRRPGSSMHVEIGIKTHEGYFQPIARSGRADFPRSGPSPDTRLDWMTITSDGAPPCVAPYRSRYSGPAPSLPAREGGGYVDVWRAGHAPPAERDAPLREHASWSSHSIKHTTHTRHVERWWNVDEWRAEWRSGLRFLRWEHFDPHRVGLELLGEEPVHMELEGGEMTIYGPIQITLRSFESQGGRRVLSTWSMRWVQATSPMIEAWRRTSTRKLISKWEREQTMLGASEGQGLLERGASELLYAGGSERLWLGASEWAAAGASETRWTGASELFAVAASGFRGASETLGASEGAGGSRFAGASEQQGTSERWGGRLEGSERR